MEWKGNRLLCLFSTTLHRMENFNSAEMAQYVVPDIGVFLLSLTLLVLGIHGKRTYKLLDDSEEGHAAGDEDDDESEKGDV